VDTTVPATVVPVRGVQTGPQAVLSPRLANRLGLRVVPVGFTASGADISQDEQEAATEGLAALHGGTSFYVERGYVPDSSTVIVEWILFGLGAVLMLGGTLTATFLALSDARPDLATLASVGASPRTRRGVAASYATFIGMVGALLGVGVGFVPGVAVTYPLTGADWSPGGSSGPSHFLDVPWLMVLGLVVLLPLLTAAVVGLAVRSRLPLVARLD
jgi:putative ABC transport system permease protein